MVSVNATHIVLFTSVNSLHKFFLVLQGLTALSAWKMIVRLILFTTYFDEWHFLYMATFHFLLKTPCWLPVHYTILLLCVKLVGIINSGINAYILLILYIYSSLANILFVILKYWNCNLSELYDPIMLNIANIM